MSQETRRDLLSVLIRRAGTATTRVIADFSSERQLLESLEQRMFLSADFPGASVELENQSVLSVVYADFDGDSFLDAAVTLEQDNTSTGRVIVLKGRGDTSFGEQLSNQTVPGSNANELVVEDFNNDGTPDLAAVADDFIAVALNNGDGSFGSWIIGGQGDDDDRRSHDDDDDDDDDRGVRRGRSIAVGELNGDGNQDLVVGDGYGDLTVFIGNGDGTFEQGETYNANNSSNSSIAEIRDVELADFDEDGVLDIIAVTGKDSASNNSQKSKISTWTGNGDGTFTFHCDFRTPDRPVDVEYVDIDGNGFGDIVVLNDPNPDRVDQQLTVFRGFDGDGFDGGQTIDKGILPRGASLAHGNLDNGPIEELVVGDGYGQVVVLDQFNASTGEFGQIERFRVGERANDTELADLDNDGLLDVLIGDGYGDLVALRGAGDSQFIDRLEFPGADVPEKHVDAYTLAQGDFDGDGDVDIFVPGNSIEEGYVLLNDGNADFTATESFTVGRAILRAVAGDLNNDGFDDVVLSAEKTRVDGGKGAVEVYLSNGDGTFTRELYALAGATTVALGDFDGDGDLDIAAGDQGRNRVFLFANNGFGSFGSPGQASTGDGLFNHIAAGDVNNDGRDDVVFTRNDNKFDVLLGQSTGLLVNPNEITTGLIGDEANDVVLADLNDDGNLDIIGASGWRDRVEVLLGNGDGTFSPTPILSKQIDREVDSIATGDFNNDGNLDVALAGDGYGDLIVLYGDGTGALDEEQRFVVTDLGDGYGDVLVADYNGDGADDVAVSIFETPRWELIPLQDVNVLLNQNASAAPDLDLGDGDTLDYVENDDARQLLPTATVTGGEADRVEITFTANYVMDEDLLSFTPLLGITGSFDGATGVLTLMGAASVDAYQSALRNINYTNPSDDPSAATRTLSVTIFNGTESDTAIATINVMPVNDAPVLTPVASNGGDYTENDPATSVNPTLTISDADSDVLTSATVIIGNYVAGQDFLRFGSAPGLGANFDVDSGELTITGVATLATYQSFLRDVGYENTSEDPTGGERTFTFVVTDDQDASSNNSTISLDVIPVNDLPEIDPDGDDGPSDPAGPMDPNDPTNPGDPVRFTGFTYTENDPATPVLPNVSIADPDGGTLASATVSVTSGFDAAQDVLNWDTDLAAMLGVSVSVLNDGATLQFDGVADISDYDALLASITYENTSNAPTTQDRDVTFSVSDGLNESRRVVTAIEVAPINDLPIVDPADRVFTEDDAPLLLTPGLNISDVDDTQLAFATITIVSSYMSSEDQLLWDTDLADSLGLTVSLTEIMGGTQLQLRIEGMSDIENYESLIRTVAYFNPSQDPSDARRVLEYVVNDGEDSSAPFPLNLDVVPVNDPVDIDPDGPDDPGPGDPDDPNDGDPSDDDLDTIVFTENDPAVDLFPALTLSDPDNAELASATLTIGGWTPGEDVFGFDNLLADALFLDVTQQLTGDGLVVTLSAETGMAPLEAFQSVLRTFSYVNNSDDPSDADRSASLVVNDGTEDSAPAGRTIQIVPVNDAPVVDADALVDYTENDPATIISNTLDISDVDGDTIASATVLIASGFAAGEDVLGWDTALADALGVSVSVTDAGAGLLFTGVRSLEDYEALLRSVRYENTSEDPSEVDRRVDFTVNDGADDSDIDSTTIRVMAENDAPDIDPDGPEDPGPGDPDDPNDGDPSDNDLDTIIFTENDPAVDLFPAIVLSDDDGSTLAFAKLTIDGWIEGEDVFAFDMALADASGLMVSTMVMDGTLMVTVEPSAGDDADIAAFEGLIRTFSYVNTSEDPSDDDRQASLVINDGQLNSAPAERTIEVVPVNDPAMIDVAETLDYTENDPATPISPMLTIDDVDGDTLAGAKVVIAEGFVPSEDVLSWDAQLAMDLGIDVMVIDGGAGLMFSGEASLDDYEALLRTVAYANTSDDPSEAPRRIDFTVNDGENNSPVDSTTVNVMAENDAPDIDPDGPEDPGPGDPDDPNDGDPADDDLDTIVFTENDPAVGLFPAIALSDDDGDTLASATLTIDGWVDAEDIFGFDGALATSLGLMVTPSSMGGVLTVTVTPASGDAADLDAFEALLRTFTYVNNSDDPALNDRVASLVISDGDATSGPVGRTIEIEPVNDAPEIDVDASLLFPENNDPLAVSPTLAISDVDNDTLASATVLIASGFNADEDVLAWNTALASNLGIMVSVTSGGAGLALSGVAELADYEALLRSVTYQNTSDDPSDADRRVDFTVNDGTDDSAAESTLITIVPENDAPEIDPDGPEDPGPGDPDDPNDGDPADNDLDTIVFTENDPAVDLFPALTLSDRDGDTLASATLTIAGWLPTEDLFGFDNLLADALTLDVAQQLTADGLVITVTGQSGDAPIGSQ
ncbi:MAG: FG-GAP-like repeat-containing protein, partial [Planctomycetota bacterium]